MEGLVDIDMSASENTLEAKSPEKIILYSGGIFEKYGVKKLIDAFMRLESDDVRLHIYGAGSMEKEMPDYMKQDSRLNYFGVIPNNELIQKQVQATLLVNPRSSVEEFTKYSFPSKNMEYMVSGTPMITTPLPGMPQEYYSYVYIFNDETVDGFERSLREVMAKSQKTLHEFGSCAKEYVMKNKNNKVQAKRLLSFFRDI
jgi:glycosyltransferase involved in cell wall biosynthesis